MHSKEQLILDPGWSSPARQLRVMLVQPPHIECVRTMLSHMDQKGGGIGAKAPLGLLYIGAFLKKHTPHQVQVLDAQASKLDIAGCLKSILDFKPDIVGISAWTDWWYPAWELGRLVKEKTDALLVYGGPHIGIYPKETLDCGHADAVVAGDGELPFANYCHQAALGRFREGVPGLMLKGSTQVPQAYAHTSLDDLPIPDRSMLRIDDYTSVIARSRFSTTMITSRGCPYHCSFCKLSFQAVSSRSAENVVREFKAIKALGIKEVEIYDDTFTWSKQRVLDICRGLTEEKIRIDWAVRDRVNCADDQMLEAMRRAGCNRIHYGIESGVDRILEKMQKKITVRQALEAVRLAKKKGFTVLTYFMLGFPGETAQDIRRTIDFSLELDSDYAEFSITIPYPGTKIYEEALRDNTIASDYWREFALHPVPDFRLPGLASPIPVQELVKLRNDAIRRFYFRGKFIFKELRRTNNAHSLLRKAGMGVRLFGSLLSSTEPTKKGCA